MAELSSNLLYAAFILYLIATFLFGDRSRINAVRRKRNKTNGQNWAFSSPFSGLRRKLGISSPDGLLPDMLR